MTSGTGQILSALIGSIGGLFHGSDPTNQQRKSFDGTTADPLKLLTEALNANRGLGQALTKKARAGVQLRTVVPSMNNPKFADDPAIKNPDLLKYAGLDLGDIFGAPTPVTPPQQRSQDPTKIDPTTGELYRRGSEMNPKINRGAGMDGGAPNHMGEGAQINGIDDVLRAMMDPLLYTSRKKKATNTDSEEDGR